MLGQAGRGWHNTHMVVSSLPAYFASREPRGVFHSASAMPNSTTICHYRNGMYVVIVVVIVVVI